MGVRRALFPRRMGGQLVLRFRRQGMTLLKVRHKTTYRYARPVELGEHRMMFRPRASHDLNLKKAKLVIRPEPVSIRWVHDVFDNSVAFAHFGGLAVKELSFDSTLTVDHTPYSSPVPEIDEAARTYPFLYDREDEPDLRPSIALQYPDEGGRLTKWARQFLHPGRPTNDTFSLLATMTTAVREQFRYLRREEMGVQHPIETLLLGSGSCRDFAVLMMEAARTLGFAARFVSGYLYVPSQGDERPVGGGATHAWVQVYLPCAGWLEFDPTNAIVGNRNLILIAAARHPRQAIPLSGTYEGSREDFIGMTVEVAVTGETPAAAPERAGEHGYSDRLRPDDRGSARDRDAANAQRPSLARA